MYFSYERSARLFTIYAFNHDTSIVYHFALPRRISVLDELNSAYGGGVSANDAAVYHAGKRGRSGASAFSANSRICVNSSCKSCTRSAPTFSCEYCSRTLSTLTRSRNKTRTFSFFLPGMGMMLSPWPSSHASATSPAVALWRAPMASRPEEERGRWGSSLPRTCEVGVVSRVRYLKTYLSCSHGVVAPRVVLREVVWGFCVVRSIKCQVASKNEPARVLTGQYALAEGCERNDSDPEFFRSCEQPAPLDDELCGRVFRLDRHHGVHGVRPAESLRRQLAYGQMLDSSCPAEIAIYQQYSRAVTATTYLTYSTIAAMLFSMGTVGSGRCR